jgi:hypothetical protein
MLPTTIEVFKASLKADPTITPFDRARLLAVMRAGGEPQTKAAPPDSVPRLMRRAEVARRLACSLRTVDKLAASGVIQKRKLPNRRRASGFLESDVIALISG